MLSTNVDPFAEYIWDSRTIVIEGNQDWSIQWGGVLNQDSQFLFNPWVVLVVVPGRWLYLPQTDQPRFHILQQYQSNACDWVDSKVKYTVVSWFSTSNLGRLHLIYNEEAQTVSWFSGRSRQVALSASGRSAGSPCALFNVNTLISLLHNRAQPFWAVLLDRIEYISRCSYKEHVGIVHWPFSGVQCALWIYTGYIMHCELCFVHCKKDNVTCINSQRTSHCTKGSMHNASKLSIAESGHVLNKIPKKVVHYYCVAKRSKCLH